MIYSGALVRKAGPGGMSSTANDEPVDERLKNIEPKMVELITSEVSSSYVFVYEF